MVLQLIILYIVAFVVLIIVLRFLFYRHLNAALIRLKALHHENLLKEETLKKEIVRAKQERDSIIEEAKQEAEKIRAEARGIAEKTRDSIITQAKEEARRFLEEAEKEKQRIEAGLILGFKQKAVSFAKDIIRYIFSQKGMDSLHRHLIDELISEIASIDKTKIITYHDNNVDVVTAIPLNESEKDRVKQALSLKLETQIDLVNNIKEDIIAGMIVNIGGFVLDGSLENKLTKIAQLMRDDVGG